ncbi:MAG TPA: hypothetical protein VHZ73_06235, partial [Vicinamibacterales bacterium]|nr:hypothetical protein [Vicinamibacterales bacterium]
PAAKAVRKGELEMAKALVKSLDAEWEPSKYADQYRNNLIRIIKGKAKGKQVELKAEKPERRADVVDLMERLKMSLGQTKKAPRKRTRRAA